MKFSELVEISLDEPSKKYGRNKRGTSTERHADLLVQAFGHLDVEAISELDVRRFFSGGISRGWKNNTYMVYRSVYNAAMNFAKEKPPEGLGIITDFPKVKSRTREKRERYLNQKEITKLLNVVDPLRADILRVLFATGLRLNNIVQLRIDQIIDDGETIRIPGNKTKNNVPIEVPLLPVARDVIAKRIAMSKALEQERPNIFKQYNREIEHVFGQIENVSRKYIGLPLRTFHTKKWWADLESINMKGDFTPHVCRHTFASMHVKQGTDLLMLKELGGWERIESVQRYSHVNTDAKRKAAAKLRR